MAARKQTRPISGETPPETLENNPFWGLKLDDEQRVFRDAIWSRDTDIVLCSAKPGTGKTTVAVATAMLMKEYGVIDYIIYITAAGVMNVKEGYLPGTLEQKSAIYQIPLRQALVRIGYDPERVITSDQSMMALKDGTACITAQTDSYIRGTNFGDSDSKVLVICDESQNYTVGALRTVLTRVGIGSKVVVIGEIRQCDLKFPQDSGFAPAIALFRGHERAKICELNKTYRSWIAEVADNL